jgi:hypothetical protein
MVVQKLALKDRNTWNFIARTLKMVCRTFVAAKCVHTNMKRLPVLWHHTTTMTRGLGIVASTGHDIEMTMEWTAVTSGTDVAPCQPR